VALVESGPADDTLKNLVTQLQTELDEDETDSRLIAALDEARLAQAETVARGSRFAVERAVPKFREAFRAYGLAVGEGEPKVAAERIRQRPAAVREAILAVLDEWDELAGNPRYKITEPHREWLRAALDAAEPDDARGRKVRSARRATDAGKRQAALKSLAESAKVAELPARALTRLASGLRPLQAAELLRRAQRHYPADFWVNHNLGIVLQAVTPPESEEAVRFLTSAVALRPESPGAHLNLGHALAGKGQWDEAIASFERAIELDPKYAMAHNNLGLALAHKGQLDEAIASLKKAIALDPKDTYAHSDLGTALYQKGQLDTAIACFRKTIALDPKDAIAHYNLGVALKDKGQLDEAIASYKQAISLDSKYALAHNNLGDVLKDKGQLDEAIAYYKKAIELDPKLAMSHHSLGVALRDKGQLDEAIAYFKKAIELDPKYAMAHNDLADILANAADPKLRDSIQAVTEAKKAIELDPKLGLAWNTLGEAYYRTGQWQESITALNKGLSLRQGGTSEDFFFLAMAHHRAGHKDQAQKWYDKGITWMDKHAPKDPTLLRYRSEAANVLGRK
jgi:tetratricopeptide (TPR) repeat protein